MTPLFEEIKHKVESDNWSERLSAAQDISNIGIPENDDTEDELISYLKTLSKDSKWEVRKEVAASLANFNYNKVDGIIALLIEDSIKWVKDTAIRANKKLKIVTKTNKRDRKYDYVIGLIRRLKSKYPDNLTDEILDDILRSVLDVGEKYYEELASDATHQINTAIVGLDYYTDEINECLNAPEIDKDLIKENLNQLVSQKQYLKNIVTDLKIYTEPQNTVFQNENVYGLLKESLSRVKGGICNINSAVEIKEELCIDPELEVESNKESLINALVNILCNAVEAMPEGGVLKIGASSPDPGYINISISDSGTGMTKKQLDDCKNRWSTSKTGDVKRTGLGLPIAIRIIEAGHKGKVNIESTRSKGTTVTITLPILKEE